MKYWVLPDIENRIKNGDIKAYFGTEVGEIRPNTIVLKGKHMEEIPNDVLFVMIGYRPDNHLLEQVDHGSDRKSPLIFGQELLSFTHFMSPIPYLSAKGL